MNQRVRDSNTTFPSLPEKAKKVDVLPQLQKLLLSVGILADKGYTTVFHPRDQGVTRRRNIVIMSPAEAEPPHHLKNSASVLLPNYETTIRQNIVVVEFDSSLRVQPGDIHLTPYLPCQSTLSWATSWAWYNHSHCQNTADEDEIDAIV